MALPTLAPDEARIRHTRIGVNYSDINVRRGGFYPTSPSLPSLLGNEAVGVVEEVGAEVEDIVPGDRVGYVKGRGPFHSEPGSYAEYRNVPAERLVRIPSNVTDDSAAAVLLKGLTAATILDLSYRAEPGQTALVHAGASGVGSILVSWLSALGVTPLVTVGSPDKAEFARERGAAECILYNKQDFVEEVRSLRPDGVDVVFDGAGGDIFTRSLDVIKRNGALINYGNAAGRVAPFDILTLAFKGAIWVTRIAVQHSDIPFYRRSMEKILRFVADGTIKPHVSRVLPLAQAASAHELIESRATMGSVLLVP
ncbi:zinc-binding dehydrogenase [Microbacterium album]|uniref:zinc-binding dehydrogenase n=1 Tax=Microbacterium album TaxID=2053191 RepID=UPI00166856AC|nr:zinc-binding dehydrogenase [Microbacterium album]